MPPAGMLVTDGVVAGFAAVHVSAYTPYAVDGNG